MLESGGISLGNLGGYLGLGSLCIGIGIGISFISSSHQSIDVIPIRENRPAHMFDVHVHRFGVWGFLIFCFFV